MTKEVRKALINAQRAIAEVLDGRPSTPQSEDERTQLERVFAALSYYETRSLGEIAYRAGCSTASASARIRDLRNLYGRRIDRRRPAGGGPHEYALV